MACHVDRDYEANSSCYRRTKPVKEQVEISTLDRG